MVSCWDLHLVKKKIEKQEGLLDGDCIGYLMGVVLGVTIGISVGKPGGDKIGYLFVRILGTVKTQNLVTVKVYHCIEHP